MFCKNQMKNLAFTIVFILSSSFILIDGTTNPVLDCCADNSKKLTQISDTQNDILFKLRILQDSMSFKKDTTIINIHHQKNHI